ncbi:hypothetical protein SCLCIDRAFT_33030 [Scleroderma citrinum Foug A]|uniref:Uncharacterized protein n=1 Tax=Scleroderma citrinum Foug A TaxID=1036808 RepID=A0A0C3D691_9AGAM|nr:hypothetical protein SCLCIDRAFT_33030 [Scleroderma citrinum Foug A]
MASFNTCGCGNHTPACCSLQVDIIVANVPCGHTSSSSSSFCGSDIKLPVGV